MSKDQSSGESTVDTELLDLEHRYWQAMKDRDVEAALALTADTCVITGAQGVSEIDQSTYRTIMTNAKWELLDFSFSDVKTRKLSNDVGVVAYKATEKLTVEGKPLTIEVFDTSVWVRAGGHWRCAVHTEALAGDPFGRDRKTS